MVTKIFLIIFLMYFGWGNILIVLYVHIFEEVRSSVFFVLLRTLD